MRVLVGTSGYAYKEWKPSFYPEDLPSAAMLRYYAQRLKTVEVNNTFYRMPSKKVLQGWSAEVPDHFCFALKASRRITHFKRLRDVGSELDFLFGNLAVLGPRLGPVLFQLPPDSRKDVARLRDFLAQLPPGRHALEFRHPSWSDAETHDALRENGVALCVTEEEDVGEGEGAREGEGGGESGGESRGERGGTAGAAGGILTATAKFGYLRLRRDAYTERDLRAWVERIRAQPWEEVFVYFKHETAAPNVALAFERLLDA